MSTQSSHPPTPKGARNGNNQNNNNNRRSKKNNNNNNSTPKLQKVAMLSTPPSSPPRNMSPGVATDSSVNKKKPPRSGKKPANGYRASPAAPNGGNGHQRQKSQPNNTPAKDPAYAGPTFHASPAPSALPMPSFFSKSYPESDLPTHLETDSDTADNETGLDMTPSKPRAARPQAQPQPQPQSQSQPAVEHKPSPIDFLFEAAKRARGPESNPMGSPEPASRIRSPQTDSKAMHSNNTPGGGMFAFEMETPERAQIGPSFATSYQDRMNALRTHGSPQQPLQSQSQPSLHETEEQRRLKTAELKHLLLNPRPQKPPSSISPPHGNQYGPYAPPINGNIPHYATPMRANSGPPSAHGPSHPPPMSAMPTSAGNSYAGNNYSGNNVNHPYGYTNNSQNLNFRSMNSPLRREVPHHSAGASPAPAPGYSQYYNTPPPTSDQMQNGYISPQPQYTHTAFSMPTHSPSPSKVVETKQMEDDLRRVLKIGGTSLPGMQSPFAA